MKRLLIILLLFLSIGLNATSQGFVSSKNLYFDGDNDYVNLPDIIYPDTLDFSFLAFVNLEDTSKSWTSIVGAGNPYNDNGKGIILSYTPTKKYFFNARDTLNKCFSLWGLCVTGEGIGFICGIRKKDTIYLYTDTAMSKMCTDVTVLRDYTSNLALGKYGGLAGTYSWIGNIYQIQYYIGKALTIEEIEYIKSHKKPIYCNELKLYIDFQHYNPTGDSIYDQSGNNNHGKIYNCELRTGSFITHGVK